MSRKQQQKHEQRRAAIKAEAAAGGRSGSQAVGQRFPSSDMLAGRITSALQLHQRGDINAAEAIYREVLQLNPRHPEALHYLGMAHYQGRRLAEAAEYMEWSVAAVEEEGGRAAFFSNYGLVLHDLGRMGEAVAVYGRALRLKPDYPEALNNLGNALQAQEKLEQALARYRRALELAPAYVQAYTNAGAVLKKQERLVEAEEAYGTALRLSPRDVEAHYNLGNTLHAQGRLEEAIGHYRQALAERPSYHKVHVNWGNVLTEQGKVDEAIAQYEQALAIGPQDTDLSKSFPTPEKPAEALSLYEKACRIAAECTEWEPAQETVMAHMNLAMAHLLCGNFEQGLTHYEWRHHSTGPSRAARYRQPVWRGEALAGATILLHCEQGLGDTLQLLRYAPLVQARGGRVMLVVQAPLERLAAAMVPEFAMALEGETMPPFAVHCPLFSLPLVFGTRLGTIPTKVPYLRVPQEEQAYAATLRWPGPGLRVGLVWAGSPKHMKDKIRSLRLAQLGPLLRMPGVHFFSLQVGEAAEQLPAFPEVRNLAPDPGNMADTAAKMAHLDLVIAVDTSVVHLAGALGKPVWAMLPVTPDWRWLRERTDSPWYPTMRLFRQPERGDWATVVERVGDALRRFSEEHGGSAILTDR